MGRRKAAIGVPVVTTAFGAMQPEGFSEFI